MKKIIVVTLTMVFLLTACGNQIYGKYKVKDNGGTIEIKKNDKFEISNENEKVDYLTKEIERQTTALQKELNELAKNL